MEVEPVLGPARRHVRGLALGYDRGQLLPQPDTTCSEGSSRSSLQKHEPCGQEAAQPSPTGLERPWMMSLTSSWLSGSRTDSHACDPVSTPASSSAHSAHPTLVRCHLPSEPQALEFLLSLSFPSQGSVRSRRHMAQISSKKHEVGQLHHRERRRGHLHGATAAHPGCTARPTAPGH